MAGGQACLLPATASSRSSTALQGMLLAILLIASVQSILAALTVESAGVRIVAPPGYRSRIDWALADFGEPKYGGLMLGRAVYLTEDAEYYAPATTRRPKCPGMMEAQYACVPYETCGHFAIQKERGVQYIALVDRGPDRARGPCYFVSKVYHAQLAGADAVLVVNNVPGDDLSTAIVPEEETYQQMAANVTISAGLVSKESGQLIKSLLKGGQVVTLALNWTDALPRVQSIKWELWTNSNDECGTLCNQQLDFIRAMKPVAKQFQDSGRASFTPHYVTWACTEEALGTPGCRSMCIRNGRYCAQDPDNDINQGYSGRDVLAINIRQLCFFRVANASGHPELWWDYVQAFAANCSMAATRYNVDCAAEVFTGIGGPSLLEGRGLQEWQKCIPDILNETYDGGDVPIDIFEQELARQYGDDDEKGITLVPTVRIDGKEYRGKLDAPGITRALCASFPEGTEPALCNEQWVSDNECETLAVGYTKCRVGDVEAQGRNRCVNTFLGAGYNCQCGQGWVLMSDPYTGQQSCEDLNECQATSITQSHANCSCDRCACINTVGSFNCTGPLPNRCTQQYDYNGCWRQASAGAVQSHACVDSLEQYRADAASGRLSPGQTWTTCRCPDCGSGDGVTSCKPCEGECIPSLNMCRSNAPAPRPSSGGGTSTGQVTLIVLLTVSIMAGLMFAAYHFVLKSRMNNEIRSIMSQYMPLAGVEAGRGSGAGGVRGNGLPGDGSGSAEDEYRDPWMAAGTLRAPGGGDRAGRGRDGDAGDEESRPLMLGPSADADPAAAGAGVAGAGGRGSGGLGFGGSAARGGATAGLQWGGGRRGAREGVGSGGSHGEGVALAPLSSSAAFAPGRVAPVSAPPLAAPSQQQPSPAPAAAAPGAQAGLQHAGGGASGGELPTSAAPDNEVDPLQAGLLGGGLVSDQPLLR